MSWLSEAVNSVFGGGGDTPEPTLEQKIAAVKAQAALNEQITADYNAQQLGYANEADRQAKLAAAQQAALEQQIAAQPMPAAPIPTPPPGPEGLTPEELAAQEAERQRQAEQERIRQTSEYRQSAAARLNEILPSGFEVGRVAGSTTAPMEAYISQAREPVQRMIENLLKRAVVTDVGGAAGQRVVGEQEARLREQLGPVSSGLLGTEQANLANIRTRGLAQAAGLELGQPFDPQAYGTEAGAEFQRFLGTLPSEFATRAPQDPFRFADISSAAGVPLGGSNIPFDPALLAESPAAAGALAAQQKEEEATPKGKLKTSVF